MYTRFYMDGRFLCGFTGLYDFRADGRVTIDGKEMQMSWYKDETERDGWEGPSTSRVMIRKITVRPAEPVDEGWR